MQSHLFFFFSHDADKNTGFIPWIFLRAGKMQCFCGATISVYTHVCVCVPVCDVCVYTLVDMMCASVDSGVSVYFTHGKKVKTFNW